MILFIVSIGLIVYHALVYPIAVLILARLKKNLTGAKQNRPLRSLPKVTLIVPCHNEECLIADKIHNLHRLQYPRHKLSIVVSLDGCTDNTYSIATAAVHEIGFTNIELKNYTANSGKIAVLNKEIDAARSEIIILSDVSAMFAPDSLLRLIHHFADNSIGVACPTYRSAHDSPDNLYWLFQTKVKAAESCIASVIGAHGAMYAFRRSLWEPLPPDTINDDFLIPMRIVSAGYRAVYDETIVIFELEKSNTTKDSRRHMRMGAGNLQQWRMWRSPNVTVSFLFLSGKGLRAIVPLLTVVAGVTSMPLALSGSNAFQALVLLELGLILVGVATAFVSTGPGVLRTLGYVVRGLFFSVLGCVLFLMRSDGAGWRRPRRSQVCDH